MSNKITFTKFDPQVEHWFYDKSLIIGELTTNSDFSTIGLTPFNPDEPEWYIFNISPYAEIYNTAQKKRVFLGQIYSSYKFRLDVVGRLDRFLFDLMDDAMMDLAGIFFIKTKDTSINSHKIVKIRFEEHCQSINQAIDAWQIGIKNISNN